MQEINPFKLEGAVLSVRAYTPPPVDPHKVFLTGLKEGTSSESLEIFIEVITGMSPESIVYGDTPGTVLLTFEEAPGIVANLRIMRFFESRSEIILLFPYRNHVM